MSRKNIMWLVVYPSLLFLWLILMDYINRDTIHWANNIGQALFIAIFARIVYWFIDEKNK